MDAHCSLSSLFHHVSPSGMDESPIVQNQDLLQGLASTAQPIEPLQGKDGASFAQWMKG